MLNRANTFESDVERIVEAMKKSISDSSKRDTKAEILSSLPPEVQSRIKLEAYVT